MKKFLILSAILATTSVFAADRKYTEGDNFIVLKDGKCTVELYKSVEDAKEAVIHIDGKDQKGCYREQDGQVVIGDEEGNSYGPAPAEAFK